MTAPTQQAGLTADERSDIRRTVLDARASIESDLRRQLQRFGIYEDERVPLDELGHLDERDRATRKTIDAALERELAATEGNYERSVTNYVREATKTHLNRLVALKAIESRDLVTETLTERPEYGNRSEMVRTVDEVAGVLTDQQDGGVGVALALAYTELSEEIGVIFEETEHTAIDIDFAVRAEVIDSLNDLGESVWESDEAMGWVYQYFGENERSEIDDRIDAENYKVQDTDVATKTQLFTPRYIVEWMVDNSLGRLWLEMRGENTSIDDEDTCFYLAPLEESLIDREEKDVQDITVLDPACGSGHMLFYAFDVLYEMYLEQGKVAEKYIPREILANNLYGIDIDPGAAQLAALALYVKAKSQEPEVEIEQINIVSADAVLVNGEKKEEVLARADTELERRVLEQVWRSFEHIREWGSLVRIEERIDEIIEEELEEVRATGQTQFTEDGLAKQSSVVSYSGEEESWEQVKDRLLEQVSELAEEALERNDPIEEMFVGEVEKSVRLLDLFVGDYDVVVSNPPYLGSGKMEDTLKKFVKDNYKGSRDLYTAFIERCTELANDDDYVTMVTPESFMFLYSYRGLRKQLVSDVQIIEGAHLSRYGFDQAKDSYTIPFVLRNSDPEEFNHTRFYRMTHDQDEYSEYKDKISGLVEITESHRQNNTHTDTYIIDQNSLMEIENTPFVYWLGDEVLKLIATENKFGDYIFSQSGIKTGNNKVFLRKYWEVPKENIGDRYLQIIRSDNKSEYTDEVTWTIDWKDDGEYLKKYCNTHGHQYFFGDRTKFGENGLGFIDKSSYLTARHVPGKYLCSKQLYTVYPDNVADVDYINGYLNSSLCRFIAGGFNPGLDFTQDDVFRLPYRGPGNHKEEISKLVQRAISVTNAKSSLSETAVQFSPPQVTRVLEDYNNPMGLLVEREQYRATKQVIHGIIDKLVFDEYGISAETQDRLYKDLPKNLADYPHITNASGLDITEHDFRNKIENIHLADEKYEELVSDIDDLKDNDLREISEELEVSPYTVAMIRHEHDLYTLDEKRETAGRLLSYYLGCAMGRWDLEGLESDDNGIIVFDSDFEDNVMAYMRRCIELTYGEDELYDRENEIEELLNKDIEDWLCNTFFRYHHCKEYRRRGQRIPIYWQLESDDGAFSCFLYYHAMDRDTLPKLRGQYVDVKLDTLQNRLDAIESNLDSADGDRKRDLRSEREEVLADIDDIRAFRERLDALIDEGFAPDFEAGIWENIQRVDEHELLAVPLDKL